MNNLGKLHMIPNIMAPDSIQVIPNYLQKVVTEIKFWYVEEIKSARRFLKAMNREIVIDELTFYMLNEHENEDLQYAKKILSQGYDIGMISESGCPGIADPGSALVKIAHEMDAQVKPHVGPNSILLTLIASGFNGQHFEFYGYLPNKQPMLSQKIKTLEKESKEQNKSQFFIETPYRNEQLLKEIIANCHNETRLCIAINLTAENEQIYSCTIKDWKAKNISFHKQPAVFGLYVDAI